MKSKQWVVILIAVLAFNSDFLSAKDSKELYARDLDTPYAR